MRLLGRVKVEQIGSGEPATLATVERLRGIIQKDVAHPRVRQTAEYETRFCQSHDDFCVAKRLYEWVRAHVRYRYDPLGIEYIKAPHVLLDEIEQRGQAAGDCDDMTALLAALFKSVGLPVRFVLMSQQPNGTLHHIYLEALVKERWLPFDPISLLGFVGVAPNATRRLRLAA